MNMQALLKQAQKMQKEINQAESKCNEQIYESSMGGGGVKVTVKGSMEVLSIEIEKDLLNEEEKETLQDLIVCTVNIGFDVSQTFDKSIYLCFVPIQHVK